MSTADRAATGLAALRLPGVAGGAERPALLHTPPAGVVRRGAVLHAPAFAEEMNKSRRTVAEGARALAAAGFEVLLPDLSGCGDSASEFADARWDLWVAELRQALDWLEQTRGPTALWLWGHRAGALLAAEAAQGRSLDGLLLWQPVPAGAAHLQQFLRIRIAAESPVAAAGAPPAGAPASGRMATLRDELATQGVLEVAGYLLPVAVATGLEAARLGAPALATAASSSTRSDAPRLIWLETSLREPAALLPASEKPLAAFRTAGWQVHADVVPGPAFWQTVEIEEAPALVAASVQALGATGVAEALAEVVA